MNRPENRLIPIALKNGTLSKSRPVRRHAESSMDPRTVSCPNFTRCFIGRQTGGETETHRIMDNPLPRPVGMPSSIYWAREEKCRIIHSVPATKSRLGIDRFPEKIRILAPNTIPCTRWTKFRINRNIRPKSTKKESPCQTFSSTLENNSRNFPSRRSCFFSFWPRCREI